jgi:ferric-dicitrate binding protein FerR (iron transport regulator)
MKRKKLNTEFLSELLLGNSDPGMHSELLNTDEVKALMYHQWKNPQEVESKHKPDFERLFLTIQEKTRTGKSEMSARTDFLIREIDDLKLRNRTLRKRMLSVLSIAAGIILILSTVTMSLVNRDQVFKKTYTENIAPRGQKSQVVLPDGTKVFLNSGSMIRYDNTFGRKYRNIDLAGEAYFEVSRHEKLPFIISTDDVSITVVGTKFNVTAYPEDNTVETIVSEGKVSVAQKNGSSAVMLSANQKATFHKGTGLLLMNDVNSAIYSSWKEDMLIFDNENFADVIKKLERWYDVSIHVAGTDSIIDRYTLTIKSESLREVLELISLTTNIDYSIKAGDVMIRYK